MAVVRNQRQRREVMNQRQAAEYLGISRPTLAKYTRTGSIPHQQTGKSIFYNLNTLRQWMTGKGGSRMTTRLTIREYIDHLEQFAKIHGDNLRVVQEDEFQQGVFKNAKKPIADTNPDNGEDMLVIA